MPLQKGFTLLELSVVLVIGAMIIAMGSNSMKGAMETARHAQTDTKLDTIEKALYAFRDSHKRLPCPGDETMLPSNSNFGFEAANPGACSGGAPAATFTTMQYTVEGSVPVRTLGLPDEFAFDGWGRKMAYAVDVNTTAEYAFNVIKPQENCGIAVNDASGNARAAGAVYTLISYGANGFGAINTDSVNRFKNGTAGGDELVNCHCNASAVTSLPAGTPTFVQKDTVDSNDANNFDDIVRFKNRWQLQNTNDYANDPSYTEAQLAVAVTGQTYVTLYKHSCDRWLPSSLYFPPSATPAQLPTGGTASNIAFSQDNNHLLTYSSAPSNCQLYKFSGHTVTSLTAPTCPVTGGLMDLSNNGYLAMAVPGASPVHMWKLSGDQLTSGPDINIIPTMLTFSKNTDHLFTGNGGLYKHLDNFNFVLVPTQPVFSGAFASAGFTADGQYLYGLDTNGNSSTYVWQMNADGSLSAAIGSPLNNTAPATPYTITSSPDGLFLAAQQDNGSGSAKISDVINLYQNQPAGLSHLPSAALPIVTTSTNQYFPAPLFTSNSMQLILPSANSNALYIIQRDSSTSFTGPWTTIPLGAAPQAIAVTH